MDTKTQQIIIITIGILAIVSILQGDKEIMSLVVAGLIGFLGNKTMNDKQSEILEKQFTEDDGDVQ